MPGKPDAHFGMFVGDVVVDDGVVAFRLARVPRGRLGNG